MRKVGERLIVFVLPAGTEGSTSGTRLILALLADWKTHALFAFLSSSSLHTSRAGIPKIAGKSANLQFLFKENPNLRKIFLR